MICNLDASTNTSLTPVAFPNDRYLSCSYDSLTYRAGFFFFQAEDGIRDIGVTGVQTCALPIFSLINKGYYDGLIFHRVIKGFMIQGGCPQGSGMGGPGYTIAGEFSSNGFANNLKDRKSVV